MQKNTKELLCQKIILITIIVYIIFFLYIIYNIISAECFLYEVKYLFFNYFYDTNERKKVMYIAVIRYYSIAFQSH